MAIRRRTILRLLSSPAPYAPGPYVVRVGSVLVATDAAGAFAAEVEGRGVLSAETVVRAAPTDASGPSGSAMVRLAGSGGPYQVTLQAQ